MNGTQGESDAARYDSVMSSLSSRRPPVVLIIRDGWGENPNPEHDAFNATKIASTPVDDALRANWPNTLIHTSGEDVGLPPGTMGNSEVGHQNIGAGRIVNQELMRITQSIRDGSFFTNPALIGAFEHAQQTGGCAHLLGLLSDGQVHSDIEHLFALIDLARKLNFPGERLVVHVITDGRDVGPTTAPGYIQRLEEKLAGYAQIASVIGRFYVMDRDHRWQRTAAAYRCLTGRGVGEPPHHADSAMDAVHEYYNDPADASRTGDEFITPTLLPTGHRVKDGDSVIFFNFRGDRPRQITKAFVLDDDAWHHVLHGGFDRGEKLQNLYFCAMTGYEAGLPVSAIAFHKPPKMANILGKVVADAGLTQFRCAETEKFAHVTFFFNDYREDPFPGETRELVSSPQDVSTYDQKPEMSAHGVRDAVLARLAAPDCEPLIVVNFANPDMVGHTGKLDAVVKAVEVVDLCVGEIVEATLAVGGALVITADHGNAEQMWNPLTDSPHTAHTVYDVRLFVVDERFRSARLREGGRLADIAPTVLQLMNLPQPIEMAGQTLMS